MPKKYQELYDKLRKQIEDGIFKPGEKLPTESTLETWGYSRNTVRHALALLEEDHLILKRRGSGNTVRPLSAASNRSGNVAVIVPTFHIYTFPLNIDGINDGLKGWATPLLYTNISLQDEAAALEELLGKDIDGVIVNGHNTALPNPNLELYQKLVDKGVPVVFIQTVYPSLTGVSTVLSDDYAGGRMAVQHLYEKGRRRISGIFISDSLQFHSRYEGYCAQLKEYGLPVRNEQTLWLRGEELPETDNWSKRLLQVVENADSLIITSDFNTIDVYNVLHKAGKKIPEDIAVLSFDNSPFGEYAPVSVTSMDYGPYEVGYKAAQVLKDRLSGKKVENILLPWSLIPRQST